MLKPAWALWVFPFALAVAQHHHMAPPSEKPVVLHKGLGAWRHPIATANAEAQSFFDQGLVLLFSFNRYEALRSFRKAAALDPKAAMAYWGMAMAQGPYINMDGDPSFDLKGACAAVADGLKLTAAPARERDYLQAVATWCPIYQPAAYVDAMRSLAARYPDDPDALTLFAESHMIPSRWHWYKPDGTPAAGMREAERALEEVLRRWPQHPGANHYYIHAVESSPTPERAIASAQRLMGVVPWAGHMVHMPAHIWLIFGDWEAAATLNERAAEVDREYFAATNVVGGTYMPYFVHNLHFVVYARGMQGRRGDSLRAAETMAAALAPIADAVPELADMFMPVPILAHVRAAAWDALLKLPAPHAGLKATTAIWRYARARAMLARGDRADAGREREAFESIRPSIAPDAPWGQSKAVDVMAMVSEILSARLAESPQDELPRWRRAVEIQDSLSYDEPPPWYYPLRESWGAALVRAGQPAEAEKVFREGVRRTPRNGRMLFGLVESLKAQSKPEDAAWVRRELEEAWAKADVTLRLEDF